MIEHYEYDPEGRSPEELELVLADDDPLARRLRNMTWAVASPEARERCWEAVKRRIDERDSQRALSAQRGPEVNCDRYGYSRRRELSPVGPERRPVGGPARNFRPQSLAWSFR